MNIKLVCTIGVCLFVGNIYSQTKSVDELLNQIEQNNTELKAYQSYIDGQNLQNKIANNLKKIGYNIERRKIIDRYPKNYDKTFNQNYHFFN